MSMPSNYRPISILSNVSKVMERVIYRLIFQHLCTNWPISSSQWGFLPGQSSISALLLVTHDWLQQLDQSHDICTVYFDLCKAFDSVPHRPLLQKLLVIQLNPYIIQWVSSYLTHRSQIVVVEGTCSPVLPVLSGVPQGSVLGPLLFLIYINDIATQVSPGSSISLFADDMALYRPICSTVDFSVVQYDISSTSLWIKNNFLFLQPAKYHAMMLTRKRPSQTGEAFPPLYVEGFQLSYVNSVKYLGIVITSNLTWSQQISNLHLKARCLIGMLYRKFHRDADSSTLLQLYISFIRPHTALQCGIPILQRTWSCWKKTQKFGLRVCLKNWSSGYNALLSQANIPALTTRRSQARLSHLFKIMHDQTDFPHAPIVRWSFHYNSRFDNSMAIRPFRSHTMQFLNSFFPRTASEWNSLQATVVSHSSTLAFKHSIINLI